MICPTCAGAADQQAPKSEHCGDKKCMCGHEVKRYGKTTNLPPIARHLAENEDPDEAPTVVPATVLAAYEQQDAAADAHAAAVETAIARIEADHGPDDTIRIPRADTTKD